MRERGAARKQIRVVSKVCVRALDFSTLLTASKYIRFKLKTGQVAAIKQLPTCLVNALLYRKAEK